MAIGQLSLPHKPLLVVSPFLFSVPARCEAIEAFEIFFQNT